MHYAESNQVHNAGLTHGISSWLLSFEGTLLHILTTILSWQWIAFLQPGLNFIYSLYCYSTLQLLLEVNFTPSTTQLIDSFYCSSSLLLLQATTQCHSFHYSTLYILQLLNFIYSTNSLLYSFYYYTT